MFLRCAMYTSPLHVRKHIAKEAFHAGGSRKIGEAQDNVINAQPRRRTVEVEVPTTNNDTERAIGRWRNRSKTTLGFKSLPGCSLPSVAATAWLPNFVPLDGPVPARVIFPFSTYHHRKTQRHSLYDWM